jgi:hypothetical protein
MSLDLQRNTGRSFALLVGPCLQRGGVDPTCPDFAVSGRGDRTLRQFDILSGSLSQSGTVFGWHIFHARQRDRSDSNPLRLARVEDVVVMHLNRQKQPNKYKD